VSNSKRIIPKPMIRLLLLIGLAFLVAFTWIKVVPVIGAGLSVPEFDPDGPPIGSPPVFGTVSNTSPVNENDSLVLSGNFSDPDANDTFSLLVRWGDDTLDIYEYPSGTTTFDETHQYLDDNPSGTSSDQYSIELRLTDSSGLIDTESKTVTVNNVAPIVVAGADKQAYVLDEVSFEGSFTDPGTLDTHTIVWDFGDGTPVASGSLTTTHTYYNTGVYTVTLTVSDDDNGVGVDTLEVTIDAYILHLPLASR